MIADKMKVVAPSIGRPNPQHVVLGYDLARCWAGQQCRAQPKALTAIAGRPYR